MAYICNFINNTFSFGWNISIDIYTAYYCSTRDIPFTYVLGRNVPFLYGGGGKQL